MILLLDTNVLLRLDHVGHPQRSVAQQAIESLVDEQYQLRTVPQILYEYWVVATRPASTNGMGFSSSQAHRLLTDIKELFPPLRDERGIVDRWEELVVRYQVQGKPAHDTRLVAAMVRHTISHLLTFNTNDFSRYQGIKAISPAECTQGKLPLK